jgi:hypothetical protein
MQTPIRVLSALCVAGLLVACSEEPDPVSPESPLSLSVSAAPGQSHGTSPAATVNRELAELRRVSARFQRFEEAEAAGYTVLVTHPETGAACLADPEEGGMGRHYLNPALVSDRVSVTEPEVVLYEPMPNGRLRLVGFEYIIPFAILPREADPPVLFGQEFLHNDTFDLWMLHVWAWKHNPSGMFATWNPRVSCEHDDAVGD